MSELAKQLEKAINSSKVKVSSKRPITTWSCRLYSATTNCHGRMDLPHDGSGLTAKLAFAQSCNVESDASSKAHSLTREPRTARVRVTQGCLRHLKSCNSRFDLHSREKWGKKAEETRALKSPSRVIA
jgi:hypothetical protein